MTKAQTKTVTKSNRPESKKGYNNEPVEFLTHTTVKGEELKIFTPPLELILTITAGPKPNVPDFVMQTKSGKQTRAAKEGNPENTKYFPNKEKWEEEN